MKEKFSLYTRKLTALARRMADLEEIMYRSGFENTMSILVAMRGPLDHRFTDKWYQIPYMVFTIVLETIALINLATISASLFLPSINVIERCAVIFPVTSISLSTFRVAYLFFRRKRFAQLIREYDSVYRDSPELQEEVAENAKMLRFIPRMMVLLTALPMGPWCFMPILNALRGDEWALSIPSTWPFDPLSNVYYFILANGLHAISAATTTLRVVLFDNMFCCYAYRQLALTKFISQELRRILTFPTNILSNNRNEAESILKKEASLEMKSELRKWVINHQHSLRLAKELQILFSPWLTFQYSMISLSCCTTAFFVVFSNADLLNISLCFLYFIGNCLQLLITCRVGDLITYESNNLEHSIDGTHIYTLDKDIYKVWLKVILTRARMPIKLSALGVYPLNTETFKSIMATTYSFFTLLMSMKERQEKFLMEG